ncbi:MAG: FAD-dependent oxidoreductase [Clostridia bacterium]|nr:FAD-dependent oxidoreductase [Clostridia bacterium]
MNQHLTHLTHECDLCIVGGGLSGLCAAIAASRHGAKVILIHDRPVLGGNASSEIRMWVRGAGKGNREPGIISELDLANIYRNPHMNWHLWDAVLYDTARREENLTLLLNCSVCDAEASDGRITSVTGWQLTTYRWHTVKAKLFADCSGDSILAPLVGARWRIGREDKLEFGESIARDVPDGKHMGMSCLLQARETDHPVKFIPPEWAERYPDESFLAGKAHDCVRTRANCWWIEVGGNTADGIADTEECREKLVAIAMGVWDHIKNTGDHGAENWELEWIGFLPGKRESRRYEGAYMLTADDLIEGRDYGDGVAYGGWTMDDHNPDGITAPGYSSIHYQVHNPYLIPYRSLYSANIENLFFAGRNISATHLAMSSTRVMATCSLMGQAVGTAAAICVKRGLTPAGVYESAIAELQRQLQDDGVWLPGHPRRLHPVMDGAIFSKDGDILTDGLERQLPDGDHYTVLTEPLTLTLAKPLDGGGYALRLCFDPDYTRATINPVGIENPFSQKSHRRLDFKPLSMPANLVKSLTLRITNADGSVTEQTMDDIHIAVVKLPLPAGAVSLTLTAEAWSGEARVFSCDVIGIA